MSPAENLLQGQGLSRSFGGLAALDQVDVQLGPGEILGVIGPNGSGKTTLVNILSGVDRATGGSLQVGATRVARPSPRRLARLGVSRTFQNLRLFEQLTVRRNVMIPLLSLFGYGVGTATHRATEVLEYLGLSDIADRRPGTLSYGDRRRVEIARAVAASPKYLLLDEPAAGLNEDESAALASRIAATRDRLGCGILLVEHDLAMVLELSDRVLALDEGRVIFDGCPGAVSSSEAVLTAYFG